MTTDAAAVLKGRVKDHWEAEACGTRYGDVSSRRAYFQTIAETRYRLEPYIRPFAGFEAAAGLCVLEIGVGAGSDFENWCRFADHATGVDLTTSAIALTRERLSLSGISSDRFTLRTADAENLPFASRQFDLVYSWGVLHHTPDTLRAFREAHRVLRPGGRLKAMIYHVPSWTGLLLYLRHDFVKGRVTAMLKDAIFEHLESPGTKAYTLREARELLRQAGFSEVRLATKLGPGDLLTIKPSRKYMSFLSGILWRLYPRWVVRAVGDRFGLNLLIEAVKSN